MWGRTLFPAPTKDFNLKLPTVFAVFAIPMCLAGHYQHEGENSDVANTGDAVTKSADADVDG
jgi:hypothetical protein